MNLQPTVLKKEPVPPLIKVREVAKLLSVSRHTVHHLIDSGDLDGKEINPSTHVGGGKRGGKSRKPRQHLRITRESLLTFYKSRFGQPLEKALANPFAL